MLHTASSKDWLVAGEENTYYDIASRAITHIDDNKNVAVIVTHF